MIKKDLLGNNYLESENALYKRGTKLQNKRSGKVIIVKESFEVCNDDDSTSICYVCYVKKGQNKHLYDYDLDKWEIINNE